jgi:hypothetical protein
MKIMGGRIVALVGILSLMLCSLVLAQDIQPTTQGPNKETAASAVISISGTPVFFADRGGTVSQDFEIVVNGSPSALTVNVYGCGLFVCTALPLGTSTGTGSQHIPVSGPYARYEVVPTFSGGTSPTVQINRYATTARSGGTTLTGTAPIVVAGGAVSCPTCGTGTGNVIGATTPTAGDAASFADTTGKLLADAGGPVPTTIAPVATQFLSGYTKSTGAFTQRALVSGDVPNNGANTTGSAGSFTGNLVGDVTGAQGATVVGKINGVPLCSGVVPSTTQVLTYTTASSPNPCLTYGSVSPLTTTGDIYIYNSGNARLPFGANGQFMFGASGLPAWDVNLTDVSNLLSYTGASGISTSGPIAGGTGISSSGSGAGRFSAGAGATPFPISGNAYELIGPAQTGTEYQEMVPNAAATGFLYDTSITPATAGTITFSGTGIATIPLSTGGTYPAGMYAGSGTGPPCQISGNGTNATCTTTMNSGGTAVASFNVGLPGSGYTLATASVPNQNFRSYLATAGIPQGGTGQATANAAFNALSPMTTLGDIEYENSTPAAARLAGNTSATKNFLTQTGNGTTSSAPLWGPLASGDIPNNAANTTGTASNAIAVNTNAFPAAGTFVSGGMPCYTSTTVEASSLLFNTAQPIIGSGAGTCPVSASGIKFGNNLIQSTANASNMTYSSGNGNVNANVALGTTTLQGPDINGTGGAASVGGQALVRGGNNAATNASSTAGNVEVVAGTSVSATIGHQGLHQFGGAYTKGTTYTQWNLQCSQSTAEQTQDCTASPTNVIGVGESVSATGVTVLDDGDIPINASAAVTAGHSVCAGTTAGQVTDSGGTGPCTFGSTIGHVTHTSGTYTLPDGVSVTASTSLPIVHWEYRAPTFPQMVGSVSCTQANCASSATTLFTTGGSTALYNIFAAIDCTGTTSTATAQISVKYTDPSGTVQTLAPTAAACTALGSSSVAMINQSVEAQNATAIQYLTTGVNSPNYQARVSIIQLTTN